MAQVRMARAGLGWTLEDLSRVSGVSIRTLHRFEKGGGSLARTVRDIQRTLEEAGAVFLPHGAVGIAQRPQQRQQQQQRGAAEAEGLRYHAAVKRAHRGHSGWRLVGPRGSGRQPSS